jgi:hypothetical protein
MGFIFPQIAQIFADQKAKYIIYLRSSAQSAGNIKPAMHLYGLF